MNRFSSVLGLTNVMILASGVLLGGVTILSKYEKSDMLTMAAMWILIIGLLFGAVAIQIQAATKLEELLAKTDSKSDEPPPLPKEKKR